MKWITRPRPTIDRIACPWLVTRYIDDAPEFLYVSCGNVTNVAAKTGTIYCGVPDAELGHHGDHCSFNAFIAKYGLNDAAPNKLALIIRAADTAAPELAKEADGPLAISRGLSINLEADRQMLAHGMVISDARYATCAEVSLTAAGKTSESR